MNNEKHLREALIPFAANACIQLCPKDSLCPYCKAALALSRIDNKNESQNSISEWADNTFGPSNTNLRTAQRANEEMKELLDKLESNDNDESAKEEIADVFIVLYRLASRMNVNVHDEIDKKMRINRSRTWELDGTGHGYHKKCGG